MTSSITKHEKEREGCLAQVLLLRLQEKFHIKKNSAVTTAPAQKDDVENNKISNNVTLDENEEQERKRKEFLERNRVAASKFRKRKKEYIKKIENDLQFYESEYDDLTQVIGKLCGIIPSSSSNSQFNVNVSTPSSSSSPPSTL